MTISKKITFIYSCVFVLMIVIVSILALANMWLSYTSMSKSEINSAADKIEEYICSGQEMSKNKIEKIIDNPYIDVRIISRNNKHNFNFGTMNEPDKFPLPDNINAPVDSDIYGRNNIENVPYMIMHRVIEYNNDTYDIIIFRKNSHENRTIYLCLIIILITNIISILIAFFIGKFISKKILNPINEITKAAENISLFDLSQRIAVPETKDEIQTLVITFNDMIDRLQESFNKENQFISDASHELKTPIAVIQGYINMIDRWGKEDAEILNEAIASIKYETTHMSKLIEQLLYLARDNQNKNQVNMEILSLNEIAEEVNREVEIANPDITTLFINETDDDINIKSDEHLLKQLIWIFAENGIKYSGDKQAKIIIEVGYINNKPFFSVKDNGIGIEEDAINNIFDRFYRYDSSRNKKIEGNGLGLSIAKCIAKKLNAEIKVESKLGEGSTFTVIFK